MFHLYIKIIYGVLTRDNRQEFHLKIYYNWFLEHQVGERRPGYQIRLAYVVLWPYNSFLIAF